MPLTEPSPGALIRIGKNFLFFDEWCITIIAGAARVIMVLAINLRGDELGNVLDQELR